MKIETLLKCEVVRCNMTILSSSAIVGRQTSISKASPAAKFRVLILTSTSFRTDLKTCK